MALDKSILSRTSPLMREAMMAKMMSDLLAIHKTFLDKIDEIGKHAKIIGSPPKGDKGDDGKVDYAKLADIVKKSIPSAAEVAALIPKPNDGDDGDDAVVDEDAIVSKVVARLPKQPKLVVNEASIAGKVLALIPKQKNTEKVPEIDHEKIAGLVVDAIVKGKLLKMEHIDGLDPAMKVVSSQLAGKIYGKDTWARGGGDTVAAGVNVTITNVNGQKVISASGGSGFTALAATETPNGVITVFTFALASAQPSYIVADGVWTKATGANGQVNWTWNNGTKKATMNVAPLSDIYAVV